MSKRYWEDEAPVVASSSANKLSYFEKAGKLQVSTPDWTDNAGQTHNGKTVTLDLTAARGSSAIMDILRALVRD